MNKIDHNVLLSNQRFGHSRSKVREELELLRIESTVDVELIDKVESEDIDLKIKLRTSKRCIRQVLISIIVIVVCIPLGSQMKLSFFVVALATVVLISSIVGIITNRITAEQKQYIQS